ncbi:DUF86 domain-containing protein [Natroniella acetigena]|uniref:type VII toxin-antitoxin system HepT family RNase toxin n=1 Tax=Natroniella acetigena TaxID=52004 RepID=UPI00200A8700|nr:DUF86 domain-containing protein [Natroniella acetigena]MCK8828589.1 DUF86 domain-containing protein [Natroniella acetigena]
MKTSIVDKMIKMEEYLQEIKKYKPQSYSKYINNKQIKYALERLVQLVIDLALDINNIIIKQEGEYPASDYYSSFIKLIEIGVLEESFAYDIAPSTGLRNRLVHEYEEVDDKIVYQSLDKVSDYYVRYLKEVNNYLG